jgi:hypothetical protein
LHAKRHNKKKDSIINRLYAWHKACIYICKDRKRTKRKGGVNMISTGNKIAYNKPYNKDTAAILNAKLEVIIGRKNPLGLNDIGLAPDGEELNDYIGRIIVKCGRMHEIAKKKGEATPQVIEIASRILHALNEVWA